MFIRGFVIVLFGLLWVYLHINIPNNVAAQGDILAYLPIIQNPPKLSPVSSSTPTATTTTTPTSTPTPTATIKPSATSSPTVTPTDVTDWFSYINLIRSDTNLSLVSENATWSDGCWHHARYMVKNDVIIHDEDSNNPWYSEAGKLAAQNSNLMISSNYNASDIEAIDLWLTGPFHGIGILDPQVKQVGFGSYQESTGIWQYGACLDVLRGLVGDEPPAGTYPVKWPGASSPMRFLQFSGNESPDPLTSCPGYSAPSGPPIMLQIGSGDQSPTVSSHSFSSNGTPLEHCIFDETNYTNPNSSYQSLGRSILNSRDAIVLIPRQVLNPDTKYAVTITVNGVTYSWEIMTSTSSLIFTETNYEVILR